MKKSRILSLILIFILALGSTTTSLASATNVSPTAACNHRWVRMQTSSTDYSNPCSKTPGCTYSWRETRTFYECMYCASTDVVYSYHNHYHSNQNCSGY